MKKSTVIVFALSVFFLSSCGADQKVVDQMADEICQAMSKYKEEDPMTLLEAATGLEQVQSKEGDYKDVTEAQLKSTMEKKCPDGYKKFMKLVDDGEQK